MNAEQMKARTRDFALRVIRLVAALPGNRTCDIIGRQLLKSGTSIGANYREARRASSRRQFVTMLEIAQREADETLYWIDLLSRSGTVKPSRLAPLTRECEEILAIITATIVSTKNRA